MGSVDHVVAPLDRDHIEAVEALVAEVADAMGIPDPERSEPHVTVVAFRGVARPAALAAVTAAVADLPPFVLRAHGFGVFARNGHSGLSLHVPVVRNGELDRAPRTGARRAGRRGGGGGRLESARAVVAAHHGARPRSRRAAEVGAGIERLASRHHPSWHVPVDRLQLRGGWLDRDQPSDEVLFSRP